MDFKSSNLHFQKDTDSRGMQLNSQKTKHSPCAPSGTESKSGHGRFGKKWFGLRNVEEAPSSPQPLQFQSGVSSELGRALIRMGKDFWDQVELWSCFFGMSFPTGSISVREAQCARWILFSRAARGTAWKSSSDPKTCFFHH